MALSIPVREPHATSPTSNATPQARMNTIHDRCPLTAPTSSTTRARADGAHVSLI
jgi:hypothetical protein